MGLTEPGGRAAMRMAELTRSGCARQGRWFWHNGAVVVAASRYAYPMAGLSKAKLAEMVEDAIVDAYGDEEQVMGFQAVIEDNLKVPFATSVLGVKVTVESVHIGNGNDILAICARNGIRQAVRIVDLPLPEPPPAGAEWIDAYRHWMG